jgi:putative spermidine/putrescine transport system substrate-binding protein
MTRPIHPTHRGTGLSRRRFLATTSGAMVAGLAAPSILRAQDNVLYVNSWGGPWLEAATTHLFEPFTAETGIRIETISPVSFAKLAAQMQTGVYEFDVTTLGGGELIRANQAGLIEEIAETFPGGLFENGAASHAFATVLAWRTDKYSDGPQNWADFWDVERFPGTRSLQRYAARILPIALLADGVAMEDLYPLDIERAFASLDRIKDHVTVWWTAGAQSTQLLRDGEVDMIGIWHGRYFEAEDAGAPVAMTWNEGQQERAYWVIAKDTPNMEAAQEFVRFVTSAEPLAGFASQAAYGPLNPASMEHVTDEQSIRMPTTPANYDQTYEQDMVNFGGDIEEVTERFEEWILG